jgi:hypothetical protein
MHQATVPPPAAAPSETGEYPINDSKRLCVHLIDQAISSLRRDNLASSTTSPDNGPPHPPGGDGGKGGEQIVGVFDLKGFSVTRNADFAFALFMIEAFFEYYPRCA